MHEIQTNAFTPRQTNTGLYVQMHNSGFTRNELTRAQQAYQLASRLFNGRFRRNERAFICHAVGVASSVAWIEKRLSLVLAGMLHSVYQRGQFPDGRTGTPSPAHRTWLTAQVGAEVEAIAYRYFSFEFGLGVPERYVREGCHDADRDLLLIALAHEVDDLVDLGLLFAPKYGKSIESRVEACAALAENIGKPELAATLREHGLPYQNSDWLEDLQFTESRAYQVVPNSMAYFRHRLNHFRRKQVKVQ